MTASTMTDSVILWGPCLLLSVVCDLMLNSIRPLAGTCNLSDACLCSSLDSCRRGQEAGSAGSSGGGAVLLVLTGSSHDSFTDVMPLFAKRFSWLLNKVSPMHGLEHMDIPVLLFDTACAV